MQKMLLQMTHIPMDAMVPRIQPSSSPVNTCGSALGNATLKKMLQRLQPIAFSTHTFRSGGFAKPPRLFKAMTGATCKTMTRSFNVDDTPMLSLKIGTSVDIGVIINMINTGVTALVISLNCEQIAAITNPIGTAIRYPIKIFFTDIIRSD